MKVLPNGSTVMIKTVLQSRPKAFDGSLNSVNSLIDYANKLGALANCSQELASAAREVCDILCQSKDLRSQCLFHLLNEALERYEGSLVEPEGGTN